jgi:acyl-coenzyme A thioesterase PaaI-like protein
MVRNPHFRRLEHIYTSSSAGDSDGRASVTYGRSLLRGTIEDGASAALVNRMPHQTLLSDAATLAASTLEKEKAMAAEHFTVNLADADYRGPVLATAQVVVAQPPRFVVEAALRNPDGDLIAQATGVFKPSGTELPDDPNPDAAGDREEPTPRPAAFMPVFPTRYGMLCLN